MMIAWKFLRKGAISPITRFAWPRSPLPGPFVDAHAPIAACRAGFHACRPRDLAYWVCDELWEIELEGDIVDVADGIVGQRARLLRCLDEWSTEGGTRFIEHCIGRAREELARAAPNVAARMEPYVSETERFGEQGNKALCSFTSASVVGLLAEGVDAQAQRYREERTAQSAWIAAELLKRPA